MDRWYWRAVYNDGTGVSQLETNPATGLEWSSHHVDLNKLVALVLEPRSDSVNRVILQVNPGETPRRFWRHYVSALGESASKKTCWGLALEKNGTTFYVFLRPDGSTVISTSNDASEFDVPSDPILDAQAKVTPI